jgi:hypothetical protein
MLVMVTGITDLISKGVADEVEKEKIFKKIDSSAGEIERRIDSLKKGCFNGGTALWNELNCKP